MAAELWSRLQFGFTITYHYLFPQLTIGLALLILISKIIAYRRNDGGQWQVERAEAIGIDVDLVLLDVAADRGDFRHAGHRVQLVPNEPVLKGSEIPQRQRRTLDRVPEDMTHPRRVRP